ncbi:hypothetical protein PRIPAC_77580 [Pristionchus pacificus]|uniref:Uncharacterized protein n=1 Tax=Pristionchus pacificus TaxID=54126 RepID=A0A2A6CJ39_PRIPA|nr:hypothetical protein PRIPAC_77580 [Pristionchus pacificus]|eukprot:PDM78222.1 hypothetical protein PRIPAC_30801 [Pristionchus pacificus]
MMRRNSSLRFKVIQILLTIIIGFALVLTFSPPVKTVRINRTRQLQSTIPRSIPSSEHLYSPEDIVDYRRCSPLEPLRIFVHSYDHPLAKALAEHPAAIKDEHDACLLIAFTDGETPTHPHSWTSVAESGINHVIININDKVSIAPDGREMVVQANFENNAFRPLLDFALSPDVPAFNSSTWQQRPSIMPLERDVMHTIVVDRIDEANPSPIYREIECAGDCFQSLLTTSYCFLPDSRSFHTQLLSSLRAGCIPVVMSPSQRLPFQEQLDWRLASFRFPMSLLSSVPEMLEKLGKEDLLEMRRRGRIFLSRIDDAQALAKSLVPSKQIAPNDIFKNSSYSFTRLPSTFESQLLSAQRLYSHDRWNSGRDLTYTPSTLHDVPQMPGDAPFHEGTKEHLRAVNGARRLGHTRDEEQFTVMILAYNRDNGVRKIIEMLRDCPFVLTERNSLLSRFLPYDRIETEVLKTGELFRLFRILRNLKTNLIDISQAVVSMDDDMVLAHGELTFAFRMWRENRDRLVGFTERRHEFKNGKGKYGFVGGSCEHSLILTGFAFMHKEFLFEFSYNQHPAIFEHIDKNRNCEDLAMNFLISHLTRKPPLKPSPGSLSIKRPLQSTRYVHSDAQRIIWIQFTSFLARIGSTKWQVRQRIVAHRETSLMLDYCPPALPYLNS